MLYVRFAIRQEWSLPGHSGVVVGLLLEAGLNDTFFRPMGRDCFGVEKNFSANPDEWDRPPLLLVSDPTKARAIGVRFAVGEIGPNAFQKRFRFYECASASSCHFCSCCAHCRLRGGIRSIHAITRSPALRHKRRDATLSARDLRLVNTFLHCASQEARCICRGFQKAPKLLKCNR